LGKICNWSGRHFWNDSRPTWGIIFCIHTQTRWVVCCIRHQDWNREKKAKWQQIINLPCLHKEVPW
jgi:hypothetical protein